jgi:hypothetical protein
MQLRTNTSAAVATAEIFQLTCKETDNRLDVCGPWDLLRHVWKTSRVDEQVTVNAISISIFS